MHYAFLCYLALPVEEANSSSPCGGLLLSSVQDSCVSASAPPQLFSAARRPCRGPLRFTGDSERSRSPSDIVTSDHCQWRMVEECVEVVLLVVVAMVTGAGLQSALTDGISGH